MVFRLDLKKQAEKQAASGNNKRKSRSIRIDYTKEVPMKKEIYNLEGIEIEVEKCDKSDKDA